MMEGSDKKLMKTKVDKHVLLRKRKLSKRLNMQSFCHKMFILSQPKTYLTKAVKEYELMMEMPCRPLNMESFCNKMLILSQQFL